jgi:alkaline phosphatase D
VFNAFDVLDAAAAEDPAFFLYFGDTIYADREPRATDLEGFRHKYKENRGYEALRNVLAATSTYNKWDDHEVYNDYAGTEVDLDLFDAAAQAFREYMPIDDDANPDTLYRTFRWGADLDMIVLDERSYRDDAPDVIRGIREFVGLPETLPPDCQDTVEDPGRTMLGSEQKAFLFDWLSDTDATWKVIVNPVAIQSLLFGPYDRWEGYAAEREEILTFIRDEGISNVVFLTTDFHANIFGAVRIEPFDEAEPVAYEAIAGPIATNPFKGDIVEVVGEAAAGAVDGFLRGLLNVDCAVLDAYSYALVEVDAATMRISARDENREELCSVELEAKP